MNIPKYAALVFCSVSFFLGAPPLLAQDFSAVDDTQIDLRDAVTGVRLALKLPAQRAALALIGKREKAVLAKYGF